MDSNTSKNYLVLVLGGKSECGRRVVDSSSTSGAEIRTVGCNTFLGDGVQ
jgi:hypothetical protein